MPSTLTTAIISGAVLVAGITAIVKWLRRPILVFSAEARAPWCVQTPTQLIGHVGPVAQAFDGLMNYYRIRVANSGKTTARVT